MGGRWRAFRKTVQRKRVFQPEQLETTSLRRCLGRWDLTGLGLGSTLGMGIYVLVGSVGLRIAGPSIVLSFLIAALASLFAGLCYAEFGSRVPRAGSAYIYSYVTVGELVAFLIGWNMILEALFGAASVARGLSSYLDSMVGGAMSQWFASVAPLSSGDYLSGHFDFFSFILVLVLGVLLAVGARESSAVNNVFAILNMTVILFIIIAGAFTANANNWSIPASEVPEGFGAGGFFPYGIWGTLKGAAVCFYGFVGFEVITATGEEVHQPRRTIPQAILTVLGIVFLVYASVATVVTMMVPYYLLDKVAAVATAFTYVNLEWARWIVSIGAIFGIFASLFGAMFPLPRLLYAMASDGLLLHWFGKVSSKRKTPVIATLVPACIIAVLAAVVELEQLILMMCVGTLLSYTIVATCVVVLRYSSKYKPVVKPGCMKQILGCGDKLPTKTTSRIASITLFLFICVCVVMALVGVNLDQPIVVVVLHVVAVALLIVIALQPQTKEELVFKTPLVPVIPCFSIYVNIHLMILVNIQTWIRIIIWIVIGLPIYGLCICCYKRIMSKYGEQLEPHIHKNGKATVQIVVESPTPPDTLKRSNEDENISNEHKHDGFNDIHVQEKVAEHAEPMKTDEIILQHMVIENEEKEAKIIDLLDQVLQAAEESYVEIINLKDQNEAEDLQEEDIAPIDNGSIPHRKSLSELSDAGSDASFGIQVLSKYDVIAQVHREDLPKLSEEEEKSDKEVEGNENNEDYEQVTAFNESESNSRTDESGYSDTLDKNGLNDSTEDTREDFPNIPVPPPPPPPPLDEEYSTSPYFKKSYTVPSRPRQKSVDEETTKQRNDSTEDTREDFPNIPVPPPPPPLDEQYFTSPYFKKSYTVPSRPRQKSVEEETAKPRDSVQSNYSHDDGNIVFGSDRQMSFMSKLNNIFQNKMSSEGEEEHRRRSNSTGNIEEQPEFALNRKRPALFLPIDLKKELMSIIQSAPNLRPVNAEEKKDHEKEDNHEDDEADTDSSMSREDLKNKLESIFASGGPKPLKSRLMKSNPPTPEEAYQTDNSSIESIPKLPKMEKNDTLKRQKDKFGEVLNSFRLSFNKDDMV